MATEGTPNSQAASGAGAAQPPSASPMPGALALVAASAIGSFLGARLGARPLAVAAGATVLAWLNRKKAPTAIPVPPPVVPTARMPWPQPAPEAVAVAAPVLEAAPASQSAAFEPPLSVPIPAPEPAIPAPFPFLPAPPDPAMDPRIQAWLARQMDREERAAAQENIILSAPEAPASAPAAAWLQPEAEFARAAEPGETAEVSPTPAAPFPFAAEVPAPVFSQSFESGREEPSSEADDDYRPEPLVADAPTEHSAWQPHSFAALTEPPPAPQPAPTSPLLPPRPAVPPPLAAMMPAEPGVMPPAVTHTSAQPPPPAKTEEAPRPVFSSSFKPLSQPLPARRPPTTPLAAPFIAASAIPGIEPLPSWNEIAERQPQTTPTPSPSAVVPPIAAAAPLPPLSTAPASVGVDLESLFDTPVFQGSPLPDEIHMAEPDPDTASIPASIPLFTAAPQALSAPPVLPRSGVDAPGPALAAAAPSPSSAPAAATPASPPSPWLAPANTPLFAETPPVLKDPSPWAPAPPSPSATTPSDFPPPKPPPASPREEDPMADFFRVPEQPAPAFSTVPASADSDEDTPAPQTAPVPEIAVHVAAAGEAWFDSPLAGAGAGVPNPWLPPKGDVEGADVPLTSSFAPLVPSSPLAPIVEAEVVLRPRAPTQASVVPKNPLTKPAIVDSDDPTPEETPSQPDVPAQSPREQRARTNWRSWWKGD